MASYHDSLILTLKHEGGWVDSSKDKFGGETFRGISRKNWPNWEGWEIIDRYKSDAHFPGILYLDDKLIQLVEDFYRKEFWDKIQGDLINYQSVANKIFDVAVNCGVKIASKYAQKTAIAITKFTITVDGIIGPKSLELINQCDPIEFLRTFRELVLKYYESLNNPIFIKGWKIRLYSD